MKTQRLAQDLTANHDPIETIMRDVREMSAKVGRMREAQGLAAGAEASLSDVLAQWLLAQYAEVMTRAKEEARATGSGALPVETLRKMANDVAMLRRGDQRARQLELWRERLEIERTKTQDRMEKTFKHWRRQRKAEEEAEERRWMTDKQRHEKYRKIFGLRDGYGVQWEDVCPWKEGEVYGGGDGV